MRLAPVTAHNPHFEQGTGPRQSGVIKLSYVPRRCRIVQERSMRLASFVAAGIGGILVFCSSHDAAAQGGSRSGWYIGGAIELNWASDIDQEGWNRETTCYPTAACFDVEPIPEVSGYRWRYDIDAAGPAPAFEISAGRIFDRTRLELSFGRRKNDLDQMFRSITDYAGRTVEDRRGGTAVSNSRASIDNLTVRALTLNAYYDFLDARREISPYLGVGLGPAFIDVSGVHFSTDYQDTSDNAPAYEPPLSFYNSRQDENLSDTVLAGHLHAGVDYGLNDKTVVGLKLSYSMMGGTESIGGYAVHPFHAQDPGLTNHNTFSGARGWTLALTIKGLFGN